MNDLEKLKNKIKNEEEYPNSNIGKKAENINSTSKQHENSLPKKV